MTDSTVAATLRLHSPPDATTAVEIVVPVHDEEREGWLGGGPSEATAGGGRL